MKDIAWDKSLSVYVDEVDEDHRRLVDLFNILNHSVREGESTDYIEAVLTELINCTVWHFSHEERLMLKHAYAGLAEHRKEHQELIDSVKKVQQTFRQGGRQISDEQLAYLEQWLTEHILVADMQMGSYLAEVM